MSSNLYLLTILLLLGTIVVVFAMKYLSVAMTAWAKGRGEASTAAAQSETAAALASIQASNRQLLDRLAAIETILKAVE